MGLGDLDTRSLFPKAPPHFSPDGVNRSGSSEEETKLGEKRPRGPEEAERERGDCVLAMAR